MDETFREQVSLAADRAALEIAEATASALILHLKVAAKDAYLRGYEEALEGAIQRVDSVHEVTSSLVSAIVGGKR